MYRRVLLATAVLACLLQVSSGLALEDAAGEFFDPMVEGIFCQSCLDRFTNVSTVMNSTDMINILMEWVHTDLCMVFFGQYDVSAECLHWYYENYEILIQMFEFFMDGLAWDILEPHKVCELIGVCDEGEGEIPNPEADARMVATAKKLQNLAKIIKVAKEIWQ